jgi:TPP-dependent pyruvate/acetoin dehydrogenase alpha subunit
VEEVAMRDRERMAVLRALEAAEKKRKPAMDEMFKDIYCDKPYHIAKQEEALIEISLITTKGNIKFNFHPTHHNVF